MVRDSRQMRNIKEIEEEIEKLRKCCAWNNWGMKSTPAYKRLSKELNDVVQKGDEQ